MVEISYYEAVFQWFWENRRNLSPLRKKMLLTWLRVMREAEKGTRIRFYCLSCPSSFDQLKLLIGHYNLVHAPEGQYIFRVEDKK